jgi:hypothetical protein
MLRTRDAGTWRSCKYSSHYARRAAPYEFGQRPDLAVIIGVAFIVRPLDQVRPLQRSPETFLLPQV